MLSCCGPSCPTAPFLKDPCGAGGGGEDLWEQQVVPPGCFPHLQHHQRRAWKCPRSPGRTWRTLPHSSLLPSSLKWDHPAQGEQPIAPYTPPTPHHPSPSLQIKQPPFLAIQTDPNVHHHSTAPRWGRGTTPTPQNGHRWGGGTTPRPHRCKLSCTH